MKTLQSGVYSVLLTPLKEDGTIDENSYNYTVRRLIGERVHGLVVLGSGGELPFLSLDERKKAIDVVIRETAGKVPVIVGACDYSTDAVISIAGYAEKRHADALLIALPLYFKLDFESILTHFRRIAEETSLPIIYYHFPEVTRLDLRKVQDVINNG